MVAKCVNPLCFVPFRRLDKGTLFRLETDPLLWASKYRPPEYFWLCDRCTMMMTLCVSSDGSIQTQMLPASGSPGVLPTSPSVSRRNGLWLHSVNLGRGEDEAA